MIFPAKAILQMRGLLHHIIVVYILTGAFFVPAYAQQPAVLSDPLIQQAIEEIVRQQKGSGDIAEITDYLQQLQRHPVNLNTASREDLEKLLFLNDFQITSLLEYRQQTGPLLSLSELQLVYGFDRDLIRRIHSFITLEKDPDISPSRRPSVHQEALARVRYYTEQEEGYRHPVLPGEETDDKGYHGSRPGLLFRYALDAGNRLHAGVVADKDPGEPMFRDVNRQGFDFYSWYLQWSPRRGWLRQVNAGHYHLRFGQGLLLWNGFSITRPSGLLDPDRHAPEIRYASSSAEDNYLQGLSLVLGKGKISVIPFFSYARHDARLQPSGAGDTAHPVIVSFPSSGLHRTATEIAGKGATGATTAGIRVTYRGDNLTLGINGLYHAWEYPWHPAGKPENALLLPGKETAAGSIDYRWMIHRLSLFGEAALTAQGQGAFLQGIRWYLSPLVTTTLLVRSYAPGYYSPYAHAFSQSGKVNNERGIVAGIRLSPLSNLTLSGYMDFFHFPWLRYGITSPSGGTEAGAAVTWTPPGGIRVDMRYRYETLEHNASPAEGKMPEVIPLKRGHLRMQVSYPLTETLLATNRLDLTTSSAGTGAVVSPGYFVCQDLIYRPAAIPLSLILRFGLFDTDYATRIYTYENDLLYAFSTPALTGQGIRWYLTGRFPLTRHLRLGLRIARTCYRDRETTGSGQSLVEAPHRTEIKAQIRMKF